MWLLFEGGYYSKYRRRGYYLFQLYRNAATIRGRLLFEVQTSRLLFISALPQCGDYSRALIFEVRCLFEEIQYGVCGVLRHVPLRRRDRSSERSTERSNKRSNERSLDRSNERSRNPSNERSQDHSLDRSHKRNNNNYYYYNRSNDVHKIVLMNVYFTILVNVRAHSNSSACSEVCAVRTFGYIYIALEHGRRDCRSICKR